ncbi:MAG: hypothetical protein ACLU3I_04905 [Acutalibacteraceae bacterium]
MLTCARAGAACSISWPIWTRKIWSGWSAASAEEASVPGALGASAAIERYGIPAVQIAGGAQGLRLLRDIPDEETGEIVRRQCATVFPAPAQLGLLV